MSISLNVIKLAVYSERAAAWETFWGLRRTLMGKYKALQINRSVNHSLV